MLGRVVLTFSDGSVDTYDGIDGIHYNVPGGTVILTADSGVNITISNSRDAKLILLEFGVNAPTTKALTIR